MIKNPDIDKGQAFDWGRASDDYARFRDIYPEAFYQRILDAGLCVAGQEVLDIGTGTGVLPRNLYRQGARFTGVDIAANQIEQARRLSAEAGMDITYLVGSAEELAFPDGSFDVVTACQSFPYFNVPVLAPKLHAMLKDGGHFAILHMAWLPYESEIAGHSEALVQKYNPAWTGGGMRRYTLEEPGWARELFEVEHAETFALDVRFTRESWQGRMRACRGVGASSLPADAIAAFEREHMAYLQTQPEAFDIPHWVTFMNLRRKA